MVQLESCHLSSVGVAWGCCRQSQHSSRSSFEGAQGSERCPVTCTVKDGCHYLKLQKVKVRCCWDCAIERPRTTNRCPWFWAVTPPDRVTCQGCLPPHKLILPNSQVTCLRLSITHLKLYSRSSLLLIYGKDLMYFSVLFPKSCFQIICWNKSILYSGGWDAFFICFSLDFIFSIRSIILFVLLSLSNIVTILHCNITIF